MKKVAEYDRWLLLPQWTFFAPNPGCTDYRLLYRDLDEQKQPFEWREIPLVRRRSYWDGVWNPDKRRSKCLFDLTQTVVIIRQEYDNPAATMISIPYLALAHYVDREPAHPGAKFRQFMVVQTHGIFTETGPEPLLRSEIHSVCL